MPWVSNWQLFEALFRCLSYTTMIDSIKDLLWDIRPSPHFGTVEVRVMDTPLTLSHAWVSNWQQFEALFRCLSYTTMIDSIKDLHWDIRPSPHFGTVEVRVMDTPLTLSHAVNMAGLIQATAHWLLTERPFKHQAFWYGGSSGDGYPVNP